MSKLNILSRIKVGAKIWIGFSLVLALLIGTSGVGYYSLDGANENFNHYRGLARATNAVGRVQANMLMTRMNVKDFIIRGTTDQRVGRLCYPYRPGQRHQPPLKRLAR